MDAYWMAYLFRSQGDFAAPLLGLPTISLSVRWRRRKWIRKDIRIIHEIYSCACVCRQEAGILMHNKFKRIDGIFAVVAATLPYAAGICASETIYFVCEKKILVTKSNQNKIALLMGVRPFIELRVVWLRESYCCCCCSFVFCSSAWFFVGLLYCDCRPTNISIASAEVPFRNLISQYGQTIRSFLPYHSNSHNWMWPLRSFLFQIHFSNIIPIER